MTTTKLLPELPKIRAADIALPTVIIDTREQTPLPIRRLPTIRAGLYSGDYGIKGLEMRFAVERKSIADLVASLSSGRARFEHELHRLRGFDFARLLIVGKESDLRAGLYRSRMNPKSVIHSLYAFEVRYRLQYVFADTPEAAGKLVERWAWFYSREVVETTNGMVKAEKQRKGGE